MRAGLVVLLIAACAPRVANLPRPVEDDLDMPPPGAMKDRDLAAADPARPSADPAPSTTDAVLPTTEPATHALAEPASPTAPRRAPPVALDPARSVAAWPSATRPVVDARDQRPDSQRLVAPPGKGLRTGTIARDRLLAVLNAGPGHFLRQLEVAPRLSGDHFVGWELVQLIDRDGPLNDIDLAAGDVLLAINGHVLSRPEQLQAMWDSLRTANEVTVHLWRGDKKLDLRFQIEPRAP